MTEPAESMAEPAVEPAAPESPAVRPKARPEELENWEQAHHGVRVHWAGAGVTPEDLTYPAYWEKTVARHRFHFGDRIVVYAFDRQWRCELTALSADAEGLVCHVDRLVHFKSQTEPDDSDGHYVIRREGGRDPFTIYRVKDGARMPGSYRTRGEALRARGALYPKTV